MIVPLLRLLFDIEKTVATKPTLAFSFNSAFEYFNFYFGQIIQQNEKATALLYICAFVLLVFLIKNLFLYAAFYVMAPIRTGVVRDLRNALYHKILVLPISYFSNERKGDLITRLSSDVQEIEHNIINSLEKLIREPLTIFVFLMAMFFISPRLTVFVLIFLPLSGFIVGRIGRSLKRSSSQGQEKLGYLMSVIEESISGLRIIKAFNAFEVQTDKFKEENNLFRKIINKMMRRRDMASPLSEFLGIGIVVTVLWYGGKLVLNQQGSLDAETFIAFILIFSQLIKPAKGFTTALYNYQKGLASLERIEEVLDADEKITEIENPISKETFTQSIVFDDVHFKYDERPTLTDINFEIRKGQMVALVGQSGAGKSTIADLLPRFFDVIEGAVLIDDIDIRQYKIDDLRNLMGIVTQNPILFNDTVAKNIAFGKTDANKEAIIEAAKVANAHQFILDMPNGYDTIIGENGNKLSGGEKQRITIARAVLKNPPILILDEATSSLDAESEQLVQKALFNLMQNRTSLVIAHRLSTIQYADKILVMKQGKIIESGNHISLISKNGAYSKLVEMQAI